MLSRVVWTTTLLATAATGGSPPDAQDTEALRRRVTELEATVARLQAEQSEADWLTEQRSNEIRGLVRDVLADADTRASLLQDGMTGGWDNGFFLASSDGKFRMNISGQIQFRYVWNYQDNGPEDDYRSGFERRRTKLKFGGHIGDSSLQYRINTAFRRSGGGLALEDAAIVKDFDNGWQIAFGQFKLPFMREELVSSSRQLAADRSLVNAKFSQRRAQGIQLGYTAGDFNAKVMYHDGARTRNSPALEYHTEFAVTGRIEWLVAGDWKQVREFTSWDAESFAFLLGGALAYEREEYGTPDGPEEETFTWTIDGSLNFGGANAFAAIVGRHLDVADADQYGIVVQGGFFFVPDEWEAFVRYEYGDLDLAGQSDLSVITVGVNRYFVKHSMKWTTDVGIGLDEVSSDWANDGAGWREDSPGEDGQVVLRSQFQVLF